MKCIPRKLTIMFAGSPKHALRGFCNWNSFSNLSRFVALVFVGNGVLRFFLTCFEPVNFVLLKF